MSKWMKGCLVILALMALAMWWGYRKMASVASGPPPDVTIHAPASRVFASLANGDSIPTWMGRGNIVLVSRHGMLLPGDTISVQLRRAFGGRFERIRWIVSAVVPDKLLVLEVRSDTTGTLLGTRRDSLISIGDSTRVVSNVVVALPGTVEEVRSVVRACLDNVQRHVGADAPAWVLVEQVGDRVVVTVRDEGPGISPGRLEQAAGEGRLGVSESIRGRMAALGGRADVVTGPGQGTEWELAVSVPHRASARGVWA